ncbi:response regulator [bacterium]|nr:MAG: response regulator [bacterium]
MDTERYILIVEDSRTQSKHIESIIIQLGYPVKLSYDGADALEQITRQKPLLVVSDILMPAMNGYELCKRIKSDDATKDITVVLLTQLSDPKEIIKGLECGADDFIVKPYTEELLLSRIRGVLFAKLEQETANKQIHILVVEDSPTQAEQLKYLLEGHGYTVSVAQNGKEGLSAAKSVKPTIIISDILMPIMDGYELVDKLKHDDETKQIPIILVTTLKDRKDVALKASVFADGFFTKPFDDTYLLSKIDTLITHSKKKEYEPEKDAIDISFAGERYLITAGRRQVLTFLLSTYENAVMQNIELVQMQRELQTVNEQLEEIIADRTAQLQASESNYRALLETNADAIAVISKDNSLCFANKAAEALFKTDKDKLPSAIAGLLPVSNGIMEKELLIKENEKILVEVRSAQTKWGGNNALIITIRDITERKHTENEFLRTSKLESLGILAGGIAHDFNNLLMGVIGNASMAKKQLNSGTPVYRMLVDLEKASLRAKDLTQQLLTFAKGGAPLKKTAVIGRLVKEAAVFAATGSNITCAFDIDPALLPVDADHGQIIQVIHNLIINAVQAMPSGGAITVSVKNATESGNGKLHLLPGKYCHISVNDTGTGISKENAAKIFDPYFTTKKEGSGLGLATAYSIIKNHDGRIIVDSTPNAGTTFHIYLPASSKKAEAESTTDEEERLIHGHGRVLIMDDEELVREVSGGLLNELGYDVELAEDGAKAVELYAEAISAGRAFDAVIIDITVPGGVGGKETIKRLLKIDSGVKAIVSSGYSDDPIMSDFKKFGFLGAIAKPYTLEELGKAVYRVVTSGKK